MPSMRSKTEGSLTKCFAFLAIFAVTAEGMFGPVGDLVFEELFELGDMTSSAMYIYTAYVRAFREEHLGYPVCSDGHFLHPVIQTQCPMPSSVEDLAVCSDAEVGSMCVNPVDDDRCEEEEPIDNCLSDGMPPSVSVYTKGEDVCKASAYGHCRMWARLLFVVASCSAALTSFPLIGLVPVGFRFKEIDAEAKSKRERQRWVKGPNDFVKRLEGGEDVWEDVWESEMTKADVLDDEDLSYNSTYCIPLLAMCCYFSLLIPVAFAAGGSDVALRIMIPMLAIGACIAPITWLVDFLYISSRFDDEGELKYAQTLQRDFNNEKLMTIQMNAEAAHLKRRKLMALISIPIIGALAARHLSKEEAEEIHRKRAIQKTAMRFTQDIPEMFCSIADLYFFGASWAAILDLAFSLLLLVWHLTKSCTRAAIAADKKMGEVVGEVVGKSRAES